MQVRHTYPSNTNPPLTRQSLRTRKVKCDETWPKCNRCTSTGRTCDGYRPPPAGSLSWDVLLRPQPRLLPSADGRETRSLSFFHRAVAPFISGPFDGSFWTHFVTQVAHAEPAARHAVMAVSSLFENFDPSVCGVATMDRFAIFHYNQAIKKLVEDPSPDIDLVLLVCILFICIEFLRGDRHTAVNHAHHGVQLLNQAGKNSKLTAVFSQMSVFPLFFVQSGTDFPHLTTHAFDNNAANPVFRTLIEAQHALDLLGIRTFRLMRAANPYRFDVDPGRPPQELLDEQFFLGRDMAAWGDAFARFQASRATGSREDATSLALKTRQLIARIWIAECLNKEEMGYDARKSEFEEIVRCARLAAEQNDSLDREGLPRPKFMFDLGFNPWLHFLIIKCRYFNLRVEALALLKKLSYARESLWDASLVYDVSKRIIEVEHNVKLPTDKVIDDETLPTDVERVRGFFCDRDRPETPLWDDKETLARRPIDLVVGKPGGGIEVRRDFIGEDVSHSISLNLTLIGF
ncbi:Zn(2)-C6 fungal-type domain-containing protein [Fusarium falciforme]|uniref:Zn(2)-C6 fungal-type domain-containing protein n=1 Tax=Fusarium falciforme TaxID=195108 RepID=UPI0022FFCEF6|nr:Zn(2)-C6 fungal-type domain-containing protein [Fusarium falciforme]WAO84962.1 Zn(2)-C6 fungal-type domain-containing protein [Fusarium falciforme]